MTYFETKFMMCKEPIAVCYRLFAYDKFRYSSRKVKLYRDVVGCNGQHHIDFEGRGKYNVR